MTTLATYIHECRRALQRYDTGLNLPELVRDFGPWKRALKGQRSPLADATPWITFPAIRFLAQRLQPGLRVFEYGSGGSTIFFLQHGAHVHSVEHDPAWYALVRQRVAQLGLAQWRGHFVPPDVCDDIPPGPTGDPTDTQACATASRQYAGRTFRAYVGTLNACGPEPFDLILIDGRARPSCFAHALQRVRPGGCIVWDNTDRPHYHPAMKLAPADQFDFLDCPGPAPYTDFFTRTTIWVRR